MMFHGRWQGLYRGLEFSRTNFVSMRNGQVLTNYESKFVHFEARGEDVRKKCGRRNKFKRPSWLNKNISTVIIDLITILGLIQIYINS